MTRAIPMTFTKYEVHRLHHSFLKHLVLGLLVAMIPAMSSSASGAAKPNIILIMTDDMGFSDLGCYGSEINTPNLDALAQKGIRFSQFYNTSRCCPTRASLMTGLNAHQAGMGGMTRDEGPANPGYRGRLMERCVTIAEVLETVGYRNIHTGKWHLGDKSKEWWPRARGYHRFYGCPQGGGFYFRPSSWRDERFIARGEEILFDQKNDPPDGWYTTDAFTDEGLKYVKEAVHEKQPFFWYLAYNAPHFPLQAKPEDIAKYRGKYKDGWDKIRQQRYERLIELGMIDAKWKLPARDRNVPAWNTLSEKEQNEQDERMAIYSAMIDCIDQNIGKITEELKALEVFENTLILFLHDNGGQWLAGGHLGSNQGRGTPGTAESEVYYGTCWANVSDAPFRKYKASIHEGGIATPLIAHWPDGIDSTMSGEISHHVGHVIDIMPTLLDITGARYPKTYEGNEIIPVEGESLLPILQGKSHPRESPIFFEHYGSRGVRHGKWKLVAESGENWKLYDMKSDRTELNDLAAEHPEKVKDLSALYDEWAKRCFVKQN